MADLTEEQQIFIIERLARHLAPFQIIEEVKEYFEGVVVTKQQIYHYQKLCQNGGKNKKTQRLFEIFQTVRKQFEEDSAKVGISFISYRKSVYQYLLNKELQKHESNRNDKKILAILEQAAKDEGGMFINKRFNSINHTVTSNQIVENAQRLAHLNGTTIKEELEWLLENQPTIPEIIVEELKSNYLH